MKHIIGANPAGPHNPVAPSVQQVTVDEDSAGQRLDNFLMRILKGVPKTHVYRIIRSGEVRVNKGRAAADTRVAAGDRVRVPPVRVAERSADAATAPARELRRAESRRALWRLFVAAFMMMQVMMLAT